jgi:DNA-binding transcriptional MerR regulator
MPWRKGKQMRSKGSPEGQQGLRRRGRRKRREDGLLTTGEMARLSKSTVRTVRFYEQETILEPSSRSDGGHRLFSEQELEKLLLVMDMRTAGLSLDEIKTIFVIRKSCSTGAEASRRVGELLQVQIKAMQEKVMVLQRLQQDFAQANEVFTNCRDCQNHGDFPMECLCCDMMVKPAELPRTVRVLWNLTPSSHSIEPS